jgi:hypothetical protein
MAVTKQTRCPVCAPAAKGSKSLHSVGKWDALENLAKRSTVAVSHQTYNVDVLAVCVHRKFTKGNQVWKELCLVHNDDGMRLEKVFGKVCEV